MDWLAKVIHPLWFRSGPSLLLQVHKDSMVKTSRDHAFAFRPNALKKAIRFDLKAGLFPSFLCINVGTALTTAVDLMAALSEEAKMYTWVHIDAAYGDPWIRA